MELSANNDRQKIERVLKFWGAMVSCYGNKWIREYGETPDDLWMWRISGLSDEQIKHGIKICTESDDDFLPSLGKIVNRCKSYKPPVSAMLEREESEKRAKQYAEFVLEDLARKTAMVKNHDQTQRS